MKDISNRFADAEAEPERKPVLLPDPLMRLQEDAPTLEEAEQDSTLRRWTTYLSGRADLLAVLAAVVAVALVVWPQLRPAVVQIPAVAETGNEVATLTVQPMVADGITSAPDWYGLFNAYQLETGLRDISIRCNYGLPVDARVDRYIHARLDVGSTVRVFLADPGTCPKL